MPSNDSVKSSLHDLQRTEKYSDLAIECNEEKFGVHKAIACLQSQALSAACDNQPEGDTHSTIKVQRFDVPTVKRMIDFLYTGEYEAIKQGVIEQETDQNTNAVHNLPSTAETILPHVYVNAIAYEYKTAGLVSLSNTKIRRLLQLPWRSDGFVNVVKTVYQVTGDMVLRHGMASAICEHLDDFCQPNILKALFPDDLTRHVIHAMKTKYDWLQPQLVVTQECLVSADSKVGDMKAAKDALQKQMTTMTTTVEQGHKLLNDTKGCRHCSMLFLGMLEIKTSNGSGYFLRCKHCQTKHS